MSPDQVAFSPIRSSTFRDEIQVYESPAEALKSIASHEMPLSEAEKWLKSSRFLQSVL